jgi:uncharacterized membrane protein YraQ (UPF0718 family)
MVLPLCTCNVVPLFLSIYRRGAGIGPAFAFLYAGPAINVLSLIFVGKIIGQQLGLWRALAVPVIGILVGLTMAALFRREERERQAALAAQDAEEISAREVRRFAFLAAFLLGMVLSGGWDLKHSVAEGTPVPLTLQLVKWGAFALFTLAVLLLAWRRFEPAELREWVRETFVLLKTVVPILLPAVFVIALIAKNIPIKWGYEVLHTGGLRSTSIAGVFGSLMYLPILTEVALTKTLLKEISLDPGAGLALLLTGPGLSLPGAILVGRGIGARKTIIYVVLVTALAIVAGLLFEHFVGQYHCPCQEGF